MERPAFNLLTSGNLGAVVIGLSISLILCGIVIMQSYAYYQRFSNDPLFLRVWATAVLIMELAHSSLLISMTYHYTVTLRGATPDGPNSFLLAASVIPEVLVTALVQVFFAFRIYRLSRTLHISVLCWSLSLLRLGGGLVLVAEGFIDVPRVPNTVMLTTRFAWLITVVFVVGAFVDVLIAACLCYYLQRMAPNARLKRQDMGSFSGAFLIFTLSTSELIDRLMLWIIQTGMVTSAASVAIVISFYIKPHAEIWFAIYMVTTKLYSNSFFALLNVRRRLRNGRSLAISVSGVQFHENGTPLEFEASRDPDSQDSCVEALHPAKCRLPELDGASDIGVGGPRGSSPRSGVCHIH